MTVLADPVITNSTSNTDLTSVPGLKVDQIAAQSHLTKCCGDIENWEDVFRVSVRGLLFIIAQPHVVETFH